MELLCRCVSSEISVSANLLSLPLHLPSLSLSLSSGGVGWEHLGSQGLEIIRSVVTLASNNYPELMRKCVMVNVPWIFNTVWYFVKGLLAEKTIAKVSLAGASFMDELVKEIDPQHIPSNSSLPTFHPLFILSFCPRFCGRFLYRSFRMPSFHL